jgi:hypothetical protein
MTTAMNIEISATDFMIQDEFTIKRVSDEFEF